MKWLIIAAILMFATIWLGLVGMAVVMVAISVWLMIDALREGT